MSSAPPLLTAADAGQASRSASCAVAKPTRGFHVFRIDGYSWTKALPAGERITSQAFDVGGRIWHIDYYPNGTDGSGSNDSADSIALYLRLHNPYRTNERVRAQYKLSLLDLAGNEAYELPAETGIFRTTGHNTGGDLACGYAGFITKEELEKPRDSLLKEDCLAIRCDVGVAHVSASTPVGPNNRHGHGRSRSRSRSGSWSPSSDDEVPLSRRRGGQQQQPPADDKEYIRRCLATKRRRQ